MFYYNKRTAKGGECVAVIPNSIADIVRKNFVFDDSALVWNPDLGASVLSLDFDQEVAPHGPELPAEPDAGWGDDDHLTAAIPGSDPAISAAVLAAQVSPPTAEIPNRGLRPQTLRKQQAHCHGTQLPAALLRTVRDVAATYNTALALIQSTPDSYRYVTAQKLTAIACIPYFRQQGIDLSEDDISTFTH
jgi:hypothetical protein